MFKGNESDGIPTELSVANSSLSMKRIRLEVVVFELGHYNTHILRQEKNAKVAEIA